MTRGDRNPPDTHQTSAGIPGPDGRFPPSPAEREAARAAHVVARRAIRRLDILEWVIFAMGAVLATAGGWVVAWLLTSMAAWPFRSTWIGASLLLFIVSGTIALIRIRMEERADAQRAATERESNDG